MLTIIRQPLFYCSAMPRPAPAGINCIFFHERPIYGIIYLGKERKTAMPQKSTTKRRVSTKKKKPPLVLRIIWLLIKTGIFFALFLMLYTATVVSSTPKIEPSQLYSFLNESSIIYDQNNAPIDTVYQDGGNRIKVDYEQIPDDMVNAIVAIEDKTFWDHHGFNITRIFGAIWEAAKNHGQISGTSTVTQQLARNVYLPETKSVRSLNRKISEAYYTVILEHALSKKEIMEAYLNTIYLGNNSYGVGAAARSYFSKDVEDLTLPECAALAAIPKSPNEYALVKTIDNDTLESDAIHLKKNDILLENSDYTVVYNGKASKDRRDLTLYLMNEQGYITKEQMQAAIDTKLKKDLNVSSGIAVGYDAYFANFVVDEVIRDLVKKGYSKENAKKMLYTGGLRIYSTFDQKMQKKIEKQFEKNYNFPGVEMSSVRRDRNGNIVSSAGAILYYKMSNYISGKGNFYIKKAEYNFDDDGNMYLLPGKRLNFIRTQTNGQDDVSVEFKRMYSYTNGVMHIIENGTILIPQQYKTLQSDGSLMISAQFFTDYPGFFNKKNSMYYITSQSYQLASMIRQPQGAMVICENSTGKVKAMVGGRSDIGRLMYNRATNPRQPGSSIKPLSVYSTALVLGEEAAKDKKPMKFSKYDKNDRIEGYGEYWTAGSLINDAPMHVNGKLWPQNVYHGYRGMVTLRKSLEQSININAVRVFMQLGKDAPISQLEKFGISTVVEDGDVNDRNAAALALGGMTKGISPLEMASAYTTFANKGVHTDYRVYTKVTDNKGNIILENKPKRTRVMSEAVAFIMTDIMKSAVRNGTGREAALPWVPTAGKTGTTSNNNDAWFCGITPKYAAAVWIGNDMNLELTEGSEAAARLWRRVMTDVTDGDSGAFPSKPSNVMYAAKEYYIRGTERKAEIRKYEEELKKKQQQEELKKKIEEITKKGGKAVTVKICTHSGYAATPSCTSVKDEVFDSKDPRANYFCPQHNPDKKKYPVKK